MGRLFQRIRDCFHAGHTRDKTGDEEEDEHKLAVGGELPFTWGDESYRVQEDEEAKVQRERETLIHRKVITNQESRDEEIDYNTGDVVGIGGGLERVANTSAENDDLISSSSM